MTGQKPLVSVLIVNWNGKHHLTECLDSLSAQLFKEFEVILVDNGSTDSSADFVRAGYPWVKVVPLPENTGFAEGNNVAAAHAAGDYLVTLNNDTWVDPCWLQILVAVAASHPAVGMVGSRICNYADPQRLDSFGIRICPDGMTRGALRGARFADLGCGAVVPILLPSACAALYKRAMIGEIGFFDSDFFAYCEDTDLGLRGRLAGWSAVLAADAIVRHKYSRTGGEISPLKLRLVERNHYWVALKSFPFPLLCLVPFMTLVRYIHQGRAFFQANWRQKAGEPDAEPSSWVLVVALLQGMWQAFAGFRMMFARRRKVQAMRRLSTAEVRELFNQYRLSFQELFDNAG
ncbi:MAG: glycosyltransferase family 2 protein [Nitrospirae bacterium]|nr:glycosyltransferase family 2 protein [Nitrospirota bacterium]